MSDVNLSISKEVIEPIIKAKVETAILEALGDDKILMRDAVASILNGKVDSEGNINRYSSENRYEYLYVLIRKAVMDSCKKVVVEVVEKHKAAFEAEIERQISTKATRQKLVAAFLGGTAKATKNSYNFKMVFEPNE